jgi:DNA-binding transcriptional MocR family regulator
MLREGVIELTFGEPDPALPAVGLVRRAVAAVLDDAGPAALAYGPPAGPPALRDEIARRAKSAPAWRPRSCAPPVSARLPYTIPTFHNPAGVGVSAQRRQDLLEIAAKHDLVVVEGDVHRELVRPRLPLHRRGRRRLLAPCAQPVRAAGAGGRARRLGGAVSAALRGEV